MWTNYGYENKINGIEFVKTEFRQGWSKKDHILTMKQVIEKHYSKK